MASSGARLWLNFGLVTEKQMDQDQNDKCTERRREPESNPVAANLSAHCAVIKSTAVPDSTGTDEHTDAVCQERNKALSGTAEIRRRLLIRIYVALS